MTIYMIATAISFGGAPWGGVWRSIKRIIDTVANCGAVVELPAPVFERDHAQFTSCGLAHCNRVEYHNMQVY